MTTAKGTSRSRRDSHKTKRLSTTQAHTRGHGRSPSTSIGIRTAKSWKTSARRIAPDVSATFVDDENTLLLGKLNELERKWRCHRARSAGREAESFGIVFG